MRSKRRRKKKISSQAIFMIFLLVVMVSSSIGFGLLNAGNSGGQNQNNYYGLRLSQNSDQTWTVILDDKQFRFYHHPLNVEYLIPNKTMQSQYVIITSDIHEDENTMQLISLAKHITKNQYNTIDINAISAFTEVYEEQPVFSCVNASTSAPVIYLSIQNDTAITQENNCITLSAPTGTELIQVRDAFMYGVLLDLKKQR